MKPVKQTLFGPDEGNCFAACVASLLHLDIDDVPDFGQGKKCWLRIFEEWLKPRGLAPVIIHGKGAILPHGVHYLAGGMSPRKVPHSVVYLDGAMVHDPHPGGEGLEGEPTDYTFLVPSDARGPFPALRRLADSAKEVQRMLWEATSPKIRGLSLRGCGKAHGILSNALYAVDHSGEKETELPTSGGATASDSPGANHPHPPRPVTQEERSGRECPYPRNENLERKWEPREEPLAGEEEGDS